MGECRSFDSGTVKSLAVIPARAGSKGIIKKCMREVAGKTLIRRAVEAALNARTVSRVIVSTDSEEFASHAVSCGAEVPFLRPAELAGDRSSVVDAVISMLERLESEESYRPEFIVLLQPTSPFTLGRDIDSAFKEMCRNSADAAISLCRSEVNPDWLRRVSPQGWVEPAVKLDVPQHTARQLMPETLRINGAIYWIRRDIFLDRKTFIPERTVPFIMPAERSVDIDNELDIKLADFLAKELNIE